MSNSLGHEQGKFTHLGINIECLHACLSTISEKLPNNLPDRKQCLTLVPKNVKLIVLDHRWQHVCRTFLVELEEFLSLAKQGATF